jgi:hypothetical protein
VARRDCFLHYLPTSDRQWPYAATGEIPQPFVVIAGVKENHALACGRVAPASRAREILSFLPVYNEEV